MVAGGRVNSEEKTFVVDTNVLIHNPEALLSFRDTEIVLPLKVLEELDSLKAYPDQRGRSAREAIRFIAGLTRAGNLHEGARLPNGSILRVVMSPAEDPPPDMHLEKADNLIIMTAYSLMKSGRTVFFVSKDINARVKATALGVRTVDYEKQKVDISTLYSGVREADADESAVAALSRLADLQVAQEEARSIQTANGGSPVLAALREEADQVNAGLMAHHALQGIRLSPNEFVLFRERGGAEYLARWDPQREWLIPVEPRETPICGVQPLNARQRAAFELLMDDSVPLVTLVGKAGTGKTLMALASGLRKVIEEKRYSRLLVSRPVIPVGKDIGYLPGEKTAKMANWMAPIFDNLEYILSAYKRQNLKTVDQLIKDKLIEIEAVSFIRGRSLPRQFIIIDESQNLTPHEIKTIVSRAGEGSKVVLTGDPYQIDNLYLDSNSNGLSYLVDRFKGQRLFGHVSLQRSERSALAELAAELL
jgi:PhoH-like ATPase